MQLHLCHQRLNMSLYSHRCNISWTTVCLCQIFCWLLKVTQAFVAFPRGGSFGYLAAVAVPLDLPNRNVYISFNFESNYGLPPNDSYYRWIERWNLDNNFLGIGSNITSINGRSHDTQTAEQQQKGKEEHQRSTNHYTRHSFYRTIVGFLNYYEFNGTACLLRTVCEVAATRLHVANGLLGSIFQLLFIPTTTAPEYEINTDFRHVYEASIDGEAKNCGAYTFWCPNGLLDLISTFY